MNQVVLDKVRASSAPGSNWPVDLLIDGRLERGEGPLVDVVNPATEDVVARVPTASPEQLERAVAGARRAFEKGPWTQWSGEERRRAILSFVDLLEQNADLMMECLVEEMGTPASIRSIQIDKPLGFLRWAADMATHDFTESLGPFADAPVSTGMIAYRPMGVVAAITAYNYPFTLAANKIGSVLAAGCACVLMPSIQTPLSALLLAKLAAESDLPAGVFSVVVGGADIAKALTLADVDKISFTGSAEVGSLVMQQAGIGLKGVILELGGKNPNIILPDVEIAPIVRDVHLRYARNAGQGCGSTTRIFVHESRYDEFVRLSQEMWAELRTGDPRDPGTVAGPLISAAHRERVLGYIQSALDDGGKVLAQGTIPEGPGYWVAPTLLGETPHHSRTVQEEIFGPVAVVFPYGDIDAMIDQCNDTVYGLGANIYTNSVPQAVKIAERLRAANITINGGGAASPLSLIGGYKRSGIGRESGVLGIREFLEPQCVRWPL